MSNWIEAAEAALMDISKSTKVPYDSIRFEGSGKQLPDNYMVYFLVSNPPGLFADNREISSTPRIQVSFFFRKKSRLPSMMDEIKNTFPRYGFTRAGESPIPYQKDTGHYGWRCDFNFYESR